MAGRGVGWGLFSISCCGALRQHCKSIFPNKLGSNDLDKFRGRLRGLRDLIVRLHFVKGINVER